MILRNYTPFATLLFESRDLQGREIWVLVLRGTFRIRPSAPLRPAPDQHPIVRADRYHAEPNTSSLYMEGDLAPWKPRSDVHLNAVARSPGGEASPSWPVRVRVGELDRTLRVTGPRRWVRDRSGRFRLTEPEPCLEVPMRYELAFGGSWSNASGDHGVCEENPVGTGYLEEGEPPPGDEVRAPQIEAPDDPIGALGARHRPVGPGPIARSWLPRRSRAGTYDDAWMAGRWPALPVDFDHAFYNGAHPDLIYPGLLRGDEEVTLQGLHPDGELRFSLPGYRIALLLRMVNGALASATTRLDTLFIDVPEGRAHLTWRATFAPPSAMRVVEARMTAPEASRG